MLLFIKLIKYLNYDYKFLIRSFAKENKRWYIFTISKFQGDYGTY